MKGPYHIIIKFHFNFHKYQYAVLGLINITSRQKANCTIVRQWNFVGKEEFDYPSVISQKRNLFSKDAEPDKNESHCLTNKFCQ